MNDKSLWFSHIFYTGWRGFIKFILCYGLTLLFLVPGVIIFSLPVIILKSIGILNNQSVQSAVMVIGMIVTVPFAFYYASKILKIQT